MATCSNLSTNQKKPCDYWLGGGLCNFPGRARCIEYLLKHQDETSIQELMSHPEFASIKCEINTKSRDGTDIHIDSGSVATWAASLMANLPILYSVSSIFNCYAVCRRKYFLRYVKRIEPNKKPHFLIAGCAGHAMLESFHSPELANGDIKTAIAAGNDFAEESCDDPMLQARLRGVRALCRAYMKLHPDTRYETEVKVIHEALPFVGYLDGREPGDGNSQIVWDHKFLGVQKFVKGMRLIDEVMEAQGLSYIALDPRADAVFFNIFRKPNLRSFPPKPGESMPDYEKRLFEIMMNNWAEWMKCVCVKNPGTNSVRWADFLQELTQNIFEIDTAKAHCYPVQWFPRNRRACKGFVKCEYRDFCLTGRIDPSKYHVESGAGGREGEKVDEVEEE